MLLVLINGTVYCVFVCFAYYSFYNITPFSFTIMFYVVPLVINIIFSVMYIKKNKITSGKIVSPIFSTIYYLLLGFVSQANGLWNEFVNKYTIDTEEVSVSIASSMITLSQIVFVILLYFGINYLVTMIFIKKETSYE